MSPSAARAVLERLHDAQNAHYGGGDDTALRALLTPTIRWHVPGNSAIAGDYFGHQAVIAYFEKRRSIARSTFRMHLRDVLTGQGTRIAAHTDGTATIDGRDHVWSTIGLYDIDEYECRNAACWLLPLDQDAFDRVWRARRRRRGGRTPFRLRHERCHALIAGRRSLRGRALIEPRSTVVP